MATYSPDIDYRAHPDQYAVGRGEQGVLIVQPYKAELSPLWRFKDVPSATVAIAALLHKYADYRAAGEFVGMDMARKYLQMGYTRARRYAMHRGGRKYRPDGSEIPPILSDPVKVEVAQLYKDAWQHVTDDPEYQRRKAEHRTVSPA